MYEPLPLVSSFQEATVRKLLFVAVALAIAACSSNGTPTGPSGPPNIAGAWTFNFSYSNSTVGGSCIAQGASVTITQAGSTFTGLFTAGTQTCSAPGSSAPFPLTGDVLTDGQLNGLSVSFATQGGCNVTGTVGDGASPSSASGFVTCVVVLSGQNYTYTGAWSMTR